MGDIDGLRTNQMTIRLATYVFILWKFARRVMHRIVKLFAIYSYTVSDAACETDNIWEVLSVSVHWKRLQSITSRENGADLFRHNV